MAKRALGRTYALPLVFVVSAGLAVWLVSLAPPGRQIVTTQAEWSASNTSWSSGSATDERASKLDELASGSSAAQVVSAALSSSSPSGADPSSSANKEPVP